MADDVSIKAAVYGSYGAVSAAADFAANKFSSLKSNEVMVKASHSIDLGRSYLNPYTLIFT
jgi:hypothetical protein